MVWMALSSDVKVKSPSKQMAKEGLFLSRIQQIDIFYPHGVQRNFAQDWTVYPGVVIGSVEEGLLPGVLEAWHILWAGGLDNAPRPSSVLEHWYSGNHLSFPIIHRCQFEIHYLTSSFLLFFFLYCYHLIERVSTCLHMQVGTWLYQLCRTNAPDTPHSVSATDYTGPQC